MPGPTRGIAALVLASVIAAVAASSKAADRAGAQPLGPVRNKAVVRPRAAPPVLGAFVLVAPVSGVTLVRVRGSSIFARLLAPLDLPVGSEIDATRGSMSVSEAVNERGAVAVATVSGGRAIVTQRRAVGAATTFRLSQPLTCGAGPQAGAIVDAVDVTGETLADPGAIPKDRGSLADPGAAAARGKPRHGVKKRRLTVSESAGPWDSNGQYVATGSVGTDWTVTDTCGASTVTVRSGEVRVTNLVTHKTSTLGPGQHLTVAPSQTGPSSNVTCVGTETLLFDNWNTEGVGNGGKPPTFSTAGKRYCLQQIATYHYNNGLGSPPGKLSLSSSAGTLGPWQAAGESASGGPGEIDWIAAPPASSAPVVLDGTYTCRDSDPATWAQDAGSGGKGFCRVYVETAIEG